MGEELIANLRNLLLEVPRRINKIVDLALQTDIGLELKPYIEYLIQNNVIELKSISNIGEASTGFLDKNNSGVNGNDLICIFRNIKIKINENIQNDHILAAALIHEVTHYADASVASNTTGTLNRGCMVDSFQLKCYPHQSTEITGSVDSSGRYFPSHTDYEKPCWRNQ